MKTIILALAGLAMATGASAQSTSTETAEATAHYKEKTDLLTQQIAHRDAMLATLGLQARSGTTTLNSGAGAIESSMLAAGAINQAAQAIADKVKAASIDRQIVLVATGETVDLTADDLLQTNIAKLKAEVARSSKNCPDKAAPGADLSEALIKWNAMSGAGAAPLMGAALGLLRSDVEVTGVELAPTDRALINALAPKVGAVIPSEVVTMGPKSPLAKALAELLDARETLAACLPLITNVKVRAARAAVVERVDAYLGTLALPAADGKTPLSRAATSEAIGPEANVRVLRVAIEKAGGSIRKRTNFWTSIGWPSVHLSGGLIVSYRLTDPATGKPELAELMVCRTALTGFRAVQEGSVGTSACGPTTSR